LHKSKVIADGLKLFISGKQISKMIAIILWEQSVRSRLLPIDGRWYELIVWRAREKIMAVATAEGRAGSRVYISQRVAAER
jgi:hypothetical protein